jgi:hypothetical protein
MLRGANCLMDVNRSRRYLDLADSKENELAGRVGWVSVKNPSKLLIICDLAERVGFEPRLFNKFNQLEGANGSSSL